MRSGGIDRATLEQLQRAIDTTAYTSESGTTHNFYHYPARFSPSVARQVIETFSEPGDWVMDPFMGGGTSMIEALALGRRGLGVDINALAHFVAAVRTTPLSHNDEDAIRRWADLTATVLAQSGVENWFGSAGVVNLPRPVETFIAGALAYAEGLLPRRMAFARCALLRLGQWALDCRDVSAPRRRRLARRLPLLVDEMLRGLRELVEVCEGAGTGKRAIVANRLLLHRSAVGLEDEPAIVHARPRLVFTSPPYAGVHVLYHRWQYRGRKETPAPYWIARVPDGFGYSFYSGGSRTPTGLRNYFDMITDAFSSVARVVADDAHVVQLVGFQQAETQLPEYLSCMNAAGFEEVADRLPRRVPHRKWYAKLKGNVDAATEYLLIHRRRRSAQA